MARDSNVCLQKVRLQQFYFITSHICLLVCPEGYSRPDNSDMCYGFFDDEKTWMDALAYCEEEQVDL